MLVSHFNGAEDENMNYHIRQCRNTSKFLLKIRRGKKILNQMPGLSTCKLKSVPALHIHERF